MNHPFWFYATLEVIEFESGKVKSLVFNPFLSLVLLRLMELSLSAAVVVGFFYLMIRLTQAIEPHEIAAGLLSWLLCVAFIELVPMWVAWCAPNARLPVS